MNIMKYWISYSKVFPKPGIHEPPGPRTDRSDLVLDFLIFLVLVRFGPRFFKFCWSWSGSVRDFLNFVGSGPVRSEIFQILLVLVRFGPRFSKFCWSWSGSVRDFQNFAGPVRSEIFQICWSWSSPVQNFLKICWFWSGSVLDFQAIYCNRIRFWSKIALFPETAFDADAELDQTSVIYWNRIRSKCWFGSQLRYLLKPHRFQMWKRSKLERPDWSWKDWAEVGKLGLKLESTTEVGKYNWSWKVNYEVGKFKHRNFPTSKEFFQLRLVLTNFAGFFPTSLGSSQLCSVLSNFARLFLT